MIIEQRYAFIWTDAINLTDVAIARIDAYLGDGAVVPDVDKE